MPELQKHARDVYVNAPTPRMSGAAASTLHSLSQIAGYIGRQQASKDANDALLDVADGTPMQPDRSDVYVKQYETLMGEAAANDFRQALNDYHTGNKDLPEADYQAGLQAIKLDFMEGKSKHWLTGLAKYGINIEDQAEDAYYEHHRIKVMEQQLIGLRQRASEKFSADPEFDPHDWDKWRQQQHSELKTFGIDPASIDAELVELIGEYAVEHGRPEYLLMAEEPNAKGRTLMHTKLRPRINQLRKLASQSQTAQRITSTYQDVKEAGRRTDGSYDWKSIDRMLDQAMKGDGGLTLAERTQIESTFRQSYKFELGVRHQQREEATQDALDTVWGMMNNNDFDEALSYVRNHHGLDGPTIGKIEDSIMAERTNDNKQLVDEEYQRLYRLSVGGNLTSINDAINMMDTPLPRERLANLKWIIDEAQGPRNQQVKTILKHIEGVLGDATQISGHTTPALEAILLTQQQFRNDLTQADEARAPMDLDKIITEGDRGYLKALTTRFRPSLDAQTKSLMNSLSSYDPTLDDFSVGHKDWVSAMDTHLTGFGSNFMAFESWLRKELEGDVIVTDTLVRKMLTNPTFRSKAITDFMKTRRD